MPPSSTEITTSSDDDQRVALSRAASYNHLPEFKPNEPCRPDYRRTFSDYTTPAQLGTPRTEDIHTRKDILRQSSLRSKEKRIDDAPHSTVQADELNDRSVDVQSRNETIKVPETRPPEPAARSSKTKSMSGRLTNFARKPWMSSADYHPLAPTTRIAKDRALLTESASLSISHPPMTLTGTGSAHEPEPEPEPVSISRKKTILYRRPRRPVIALVAKGKEDTQVSPTSPSTYSLQPKGSLENLAASLHISTPILPTRSKAVATVKSSLISGPDPPQKRDELWSAFRGLEADYQRFQSKLSSFKANVIRSSLLSFLNRYRSDTSCKKICPEDLDRRVNILNKWWTVLLKILSGSQTYSVSGTDRPAYLEALTGIMTRPEWRVPFSVTQRSGKPINSGQYASASTSESSGASSSSEFLAESVYHNIRNIFAQNLLSQMSFVVGRMSVRHAPVSLVSFCGKACAYAFFFCPGVADILIRLWNVPSSAYRRVFTEANVDRSSATQSFTQELAANFPASLRVLAMHSLGPWIRYLRQKPDVPIATSHISWQGPWISRWLGRDTDLFFIFVKYIYILYADYLPSEVEVSERILAPGLLPIHAQLLVVLEETLYKQSAPQSSDNSHAVAAITFDDFIEGTDASVPALPFGTANCHRSIAENRLVILLRDFLSSSLAQLATARLLYAESFCGVMKIAARGTSLFDHNACFLLCDFAEETIPIITRYSKTAGVEILNWNFWLGVCQQMLLSQNSLTEVRAFSFIFNVWNMWVASEERKASLCLEFLLREPLFYHYFNHWSPMVRAYFHRLLCWRVSRYNDIPSQLDSWVQPSSVYLAAGGLLLTMRNSRIYDVLSNRLQRIWGFYLSFQTKAEAERTAPLSSAPCTPAPGRRIIIIRCDNPAASPNTFTSFDRVVPPAASEQLFRDHNTAKVDSTESQPTHRRKWNVLKAMFGNPSRPGEEGSSSDDSDSNNGVEGTSIPEDGSNSPHTSRSSFEEAVCPTTPPQPYTFRFSLEWMDRPQWPNKNRRLLAPCLSVRAQLYLQHKCSAAGVFDYDTASDNESEDDAREIENPDRWEKVHQQEHAKELEPFVASQGVPTKRGAQPVYPDELVGSKYVGRSLAEWAHVVGECDSFFARRRDEGVPSDQMVETPILGVESFRK